MRLHRTSWLMALVAAGCSAAPGASVGGQDGGSGGASDATSAAVIQAGLDRVNHWRTLAGVPTVAGQAQVQAAAQAHLDFVVGNPSTCSPGMHNEVDQSGCTGFTGTDEGERLQHAGYMWSAWSEAMETGIADPAGAVDEWIWSVYHRLIVLNEDTDQAGFACRNASCILDLAAPGSAPATPSSAVIVFPPPNLTGVPLSWDGATEAPTPPAPPAGWPSGPPISIHFPSMQWTLTQAAIGRTGSAQDDLATTLLMPSTDNGLAELSMQDVVFYPNTPLTAGTSYTVTAQGTVDGTPWTQSWSFTTEGP